MRGTLPELERLGVGVAVVTFGTPEQARVFCAEARAPFPCLSDPERRGYDAFGLERRAGWGRILDPRGGAGFVRALRAGHRASKGELSVRQMPGTFLIDTAGEVRYAHRNRWPADNPPLPELLAAAAGISARA